MDADAAPSIAPETPRSATEQTRVSTSQVARKRLFRIGHDGLEFVECSVRTSATPRSDKTRGTAVDSISGNNDGHHTPALAGQLGLPTSHATARKTLASRVRSATFRQRESEP